MRKNIFILIFFLFFSLLLPLNAQWAKVYRRNLDFKAHSIQQASDGGYIVLCESLSSGYYIANDLNFYILKLDPKGKTEWKQILGGNYSDRAHSIQQTGDGGYIVAGETQSFRAGTYDFLVLKLDSNGDVEWQRTYGERYNDIAYSIQQAGDGGYIVAGETYSFGAGIYDFLVLKLDSVGDVEWQRSYGGDNWDRALCIELTSDGGYIVAGESWSFGAGSSDFWVLKLDSVGDVDWQRTYGGIPSDYAHSIQQTSNGGYIVAGETYSFGAGSSDFWVLKLDSAGDIEWQRTYGGINSDIAFSVKQTSDGGYTVAGETNSFGAGKSDFWVLKLESGGDIEWQRTYGGLDDDRAFSIEQTSDDGYVIAGETSSFAISSSPNILVLKLDLNGRISESCGFIQDSNAVITQPIVSPLNTSVSPRDTLIVPSTSNHVPSFEVSPSVHPLCSFQKCNLTVSASPGGTTNPAPDMHSYDEDKEVTIIATADSGYRFKNWTGDVPSGHENDNPLTIIIDSDKSITANFIRLYTLTISNTTGGRTDPSSGSHVYDSGTEAKITAFPDENYRFRGWTGDVPQGHENDNPLIIIMGSDKSVTANFIRQYTLKISVGRGGTTEPLPGSYSYDEGTSVPVRAIPDTDSGYEFKEWSVDASGTQNPVTVTMDRDKWIFAIFVVPGEKEDSSWELKCFVATAVYGSPFHSHLKILRDFRDRYLRTSKLGRSLLDIYYKHSPRLAALIARHRVLKFVVRACLLPAVAFSYSMLRFGPVMTVIVFVFILTAPNFLFWSLRRRRRRLLVN